MKNFLFLISMLFIIPASCQVPRDMKLYYVKITPIGNSDLPRNLFYISTTKIDSITKIDSTENVGFLHQIITDENTLKNVVSFANENKPSKNSAKKSFMEYGCFNISVYNGKTSIINYNLDRSASRKYLNSFIDMLSKNKLDVKVINEINENALGPINY